MTWDPENTDETNNIKHFFQLYLDQGYSAFHLSDAGGEGKQILSFNAFAGRIIMVPRLGGG